MSQGYTLQITIPSLPPWARVALGCAALNLLLFVPLYLLVASEHDLTPLFPDGHPRGAFDWGWSGLPRSLYEYVMQLAVRRHNRDVFRVSADVVLLVSTVVLAARLAGVRWRRVVVGLAATAYLSLLAFLVYSAFIVELLGRPAALIDDVLMLESAWIFVRDTWGGAELVAVLGGLAVLGLFAWAVVRVFGATWAWGAGLDPRLVVVGWALVNLYGAASLSWFGVARDDPVLQLQAKHVAANWQRSRAVRATVAALDSPGVFEAAQRLADTEPVRRPDLFLFEIESYGATFWADPDFAVARDGLMTRVETRLRDTGLSLHSRFVTSPVYGGGSWMSTASALSGLRIDSHSTYSAWKQLQTRYPHLIAYLNAQGYYTLSVQPGATWSEGLYQYDDIVVRDDFGYDGRFHGFGGVPDQWALDHAFTHPWASRAAPRLMHFFSVSTHFAWDPPPRITGDVADLLRPQPTFLETRPDIVELALTVPQGYKRDFFATLAYEWELLLDVFATRVDPGFVALVFGDHQPPFIANDQGHNDVGFHVVTDLPGLETPLRAAGLMAGAPRDWQVGAAQSFRMEALYSFVVGLLAVPDGAGTVTFAPQGAPLPDRPVW